MHIAHDKVLAVEQWPVPQNAADVQSFLGFVQFFRRSLRGLAGVSLPLTKLTSKETPWRWGSAEQLAFDELKKCIAHAPCLALVDVADEHIELEVHTDAS